MIFRLPLAAESAIDPIMLRTLSISISLVVLSSLAACSEGPMAFTDVPTDRGTDAMSADTRSDAPATDVTSTDAVDIARVDATQDTGTDVGAQDSGFDVGVDAPADVAVDAPADVAVDAPADVAVDGRTDVAGVDATTDAGPTDGGFGCALAIRAELTLPAAGTNAIVAMGSLNPGTSRINSLPMCPTTNQTTNGEEHIYGLDITVTTTLTLTTAGLEYVPFLAIRTACESAASQIACQGRNGPDPSRNAQITTTLEPGRYYVIVDRLTTLPDDYTLTIAVP